MNGNGSTLAGFKQTFLVRKPRFPKILTPQFCLKPATLPKPNLLIDLFLNEAIEPTTSNVKITMTIYACNISRESNLIAHNPMLGTRKLTTSPTFDPYLNNIIIKCQCNYHKNYHD